MMKGFMPAKVGAHFFVKKQKRMKELGWCRIIKRVENLGRVSIRPSWTRVKRNFTM